MWAGHSRAVYKPLEDCSQPCHRQKACRTALPSPRVPRGLSWCPQETQRESLAHRTAGATRATAPASSRLPSPDRAARPSAKPRSVLTIAAAAGTLSKPSAHQFCLFALTFKELRGPFLVQQINPVLLWQASAHTLLLFGLCAQPPLGHPSPMPVHPFFRWRGINQPPFGFCFNSFKG